MMSSQTQAPDRNNELAWSFLKAFRKIDAPVNLVSIHPETLAVTAITRPVSDRAVFEFIEKNNGKCNIYFMVNTPYSDAPDKKLKKEHVEFINAVFLDADPTKNKPFDTERERLRKLVTDLKVSENAPTYIIDSGGGFQAFWVLKEPVLATPENIDLYEALSRGQAQKYGADKVQNIDRVMRVPFTWNLPTAKKKAQGRIKARAAVIHALSKEGVRYD
jgi:hypothetical protein